MAVPQIDIDSDITRPPASALSRVRASLPASFRDTVRSGRQLVPADNASPPDPVFLPTAINAVDRLLSGGLPRGRLVELTGERSCGRFSTLMAALATTTRNGETVAFVDLGDGLDPRTAEAIGVDLERLLWIRPDELKTAMISAELALHAGFSLVAIDLGLSPASGCAGTEAGWLRLARAAAQHRAALFVSSPCRVSSTAATTVLTANQTRSAWHHNGRAPRLFAGLHGRFCIRKSRLALKSGIEAFRFSTPAGQLVSAPAPSSHESDSEPEACRCAATQ